MPFRCLINSSVVHRMSVSGRLEASGANSKMFEVERGSTAELKFCARTVRREALSIPPFLKSILKLEFGMFQTF
jgi:hypothetical protein